jgi:uncharacterized membrane protein
LTLIEKLDIMLKMVLKELFMTKYQKPSTKEWQIFFEKLFFWSGTVTFLLSIILFIAYNWEELGKFYKFVLVETILIFGVLLSLHFFDRKILFWSTLTISAVMVGVLMALFGQVYHTEADSWELFFYWGVMILPWVILGDFVGLWILWILLINLSIILYEIQSISLPSYFDSTSLLLKIFLFNFGFLLFWELKGIKLQKDFILIKILDGFSSVPITIVMMILIYSSKGEIYTLFIWIAWLLAIYYLYRKREISIPALSSMSISILAVVANFFIKIFDVNSNLSILIIFFIIVFTGGVLSVWLKSVYNEKEAKDGK